MRSYELLQLQRRESLHEVPWGDEASTPSGPIVLQDAKRHARITHSSEDLLAGDILRGAIETAEGSTRRTIQLSRWDLVVDSFSSWCYGAEFELRRPPVVAIEQITYRDADGAWQTLDLDETVAVDLDGDYCRARLLPGVSWPAVSSLARSVRIRYRAGYRPHDYVEVENVATPPRIGQNLATAIRELFTWRFNNRGNLDLSVPGGIDSMFWSERADL